MCHVCSVCVLCGWAGGRAGVCVSVVCLHVCVHTCVTGIVTHNVISGLAYIAVCSRHVKCFILQKDNNKGHTKFKLQLMLVDMCTHHLSLQIIY